MTTHHEGVDPAPPFFLFDGECGFCQRWVRWLARRVPDIDFVPSQSIVDLAGLGLSHEDVRTASYWVDEHGVAHRGHSSIARVLQQTHGVWRVVGLALELPPISWMAAAVYGAVALNRHRLPAPR